MQVIALIISLLSLALSAFALMEVRKGKKENKDTVVL